MSRPPRSSDRPCSSDRPRSADRSAPRRLPRRLRQVSPGRRGLVLAWCGFTVTFGLMRLLTWLIHIDVAGVGDVSAGGVHIHHYVWGILLLLVTGALSLVERSPRWRAWLGLAYGAGAALVVDEAALLISLEDVYWDSEGGVSIALALIVIGVVGSLLALTAKPVTDTTADSADATGTTDASDASGGTRGSV